MNPRASLSILERTFLTLQGWTSTYVALYCMFTADDIILGKRFFYSPNIQSGSLAQTDSYSMGIGAASQGTNGKDIQLTPHPHPER